MKRTLLLVVGISLCTPALSRAQTDVIPPDSFNESARAERFWAESEYLLWWIKAAPVPTPLVATGPITGNLAPILGQPGYQTLLGGSDVDLGSRSGGRFTLGGWVDSERSIGLEATYFFLCSHATEQGVASSGLPGSAFLALPFFDVTTLDESSTRIALPGGFSGIATLANSMRMQGWEATGVFNLARSDRGRLELIGGFRYWNLDEELEFATNSVTVIGPADVFQTNDEFATNNHFYGGQIGVRGEINRGRFFLQGGGKVALGSMRQTVNTSGGLLTNDFNNLGDPQLFPGGYLTAPTNIGHQSRDRFAVIPEFNLSVGVQVTQAIRVKVGYTFLYVSDVVRPGDQVDRGINPIGPGFTGIPNTPLTGPARPAPRFESTDIWAHGLNFGVELRY